MAQVNNNVNVVNAYFDQIAKLNPKIKDIQQKLVSDISNDGKIDAKELESEKAAFKAAGGTDEDFSKFMESALGIKDVSEAGFSPTAIKFTPKGSEKQIQVTNDKDASFKKTVDDPLNFNYNTTESRDISRSIMSGAKTTIKDSGLAVKVNPKTKVIYMAAPNKEKFEDVKALQKELGVKVDGYIGPQTLKNLVEQFKSASEETPPNTAKMEKLKAMAEKLGLDKAFSGQKIMGEDLCEMLNAPPKKENKADAASVTDDKKEVDTETTTVEDKKDPTIKPTPKDNKVETNAQATEKNTVLNKCFESFLKSGSLKDVNAGVISAQNATINNGKDKLSLADITKFIANNDKFLNLVDEAIADKDNSSLTEITKMVGYMDMPNAEKFLNHMKSKVGQLDIADQLIKIINDYINTQKAQS